MCSPEFVAHRLQSWYSASVLSDRVKAQKPKSDAPNNVFPRLHGQIAPGRAWEPGCDIAEGDSDVARSAREPVPHFEFSRIAIFSSEERQPLDALKAPFSAGRKIHAQTQSYPGRRFGEVPSVRAVPPPAAPLPLPLQAKLEVGSVADPLEKEADASADRVMRTPAAASAAGVRTSTATVGSAAAPHVVHDVLRSPGEALDAGVRAFMEPRFGHDFRQVRVHADARAAESAQAVRARSYTVGQHVVFGAASYAPGTADGRRLIAHELSHVVQQRRGPVVGIQRQAAEDWNFTRGDYAKVTGTGQKKLTVASDSSWFPAKLQQNLLSTLDFVFGPTISPPATEGVNATDFFHGHLVIKKDPATAAQTTTAAAQGDKVDADLKTKRTAALGKEVKFENVGPAPNFPITSGYPFVRDATSSAEQKVAAYKGAVENVEPSLGKVMEDAAKIPGAAVMYHTFEFSQPSDLALMGQKIDPNSPRRNYVTPLDTNRPVPYTTPKGATYEKEYTIVTKFSFLVDKTGAVHVRPFDPGSTLFTSLELSTITGKPFAKSPGFER
jgi:Domain of unknown function (DUF4157)